MKVKKILYNSVRRLNVNYNNRFKGLELNDINVFIGENGAGKSTMIDIVRSISDLSVIPSLARENPLSGTTPGYMVEFDDSGSKHVYTKAPKDINKCLTRYLWCSLKDGEEVIFDSDVSKFNLEENLKLLHGVEFKINNKINYRACSSPSLESPNEYYFHELNKIESKLNGAYDRKLNDDGTLKEFIPLNSNNLILSDDGLINSWSIEDKSMSSNIPLSWLPSGWRSYAEVTSYLMSCNNGSICLLEEPEINLHPRLQRLLLKRIEEVSIQKNLQILLSTHSPAMINAKLNKKFSVYHTKGGIVKRLDNEKELLDDLGYKASDIFQVNCVVWVEGPSDRIYIKHWLSVIDDNLIEGVDYSFIFYGGRLLSHFDLKNQSEDFISMLKININSIIVIDSDKESYDDYLNETKKRIIDSCKSRKSKVWVTDGREIENYLDQDLLRESIASVHPSFYKQLNTGKWSNLLMYKTKGDFKSKVADKVKVAKKYVESSNGKINLGRELEERVLSIYRFIIKSGE